MAKIVGMGLVRRIVRLLRRAVHRILGTEFVVLRHIPTAEGGAAGRNEFDRLRLFVDSEVSLLRSLLDSLATNQTKLGHAETTILHQSDRLAIVESLLNWRLFGLPGRVCNVKLEQARLLAGALDVEECLKILGDRSYRPHDSWKSLPPAVRGAGLAFLSSNDVMNMHASFSAVEHWTWVRDPTDLFQPDEIPSSEALFELSPVDVAARFSSPEFSLVWLADVMERMTPLQTLVLLRRIRGGLVSQGVCSGFFADFASVGDGAYWTDPRRLRPLTHESVENLAKLAGFSTVVFSPVEGHSAWVRFVFSVD